MKFRGVGRFAFNAWWLFFPSTGGFCLISGTLAEVMRRHVENEERALKFLCYDNETLQRWHQNKHVNRRTCPYCAEVADALRR